MPPRDRATMAFGARMLEHRGLAKQLGNREQPAAFVSPGIGPAVPVRCLLLVEDVLERVRVNGPCEPSPDGLHALTLLDALPKRIVYGETAERQ